MELRDYSPTKKALQINLDDSIYGTFAEIGAGQEVARHFFQAGRASHTVAKTMSAYDMTFSDHIYGKEARYVCESRLLKMLDHEYSLLQERLGAQRGQNTRFFAFADTVATGSQNQGVNRSHGWMGVRFQSRPGGEANDIILHVKLWDRFRLQQQEALGILGVNLMHMAFMPPATQQERISYLLDSLDTRRIEVNMIRFTGPDFKGMDNRLMNLELVKQHLTEAIMFGANSEVLHTGDALFHKPVLVQRGAYRPVTSANLAICSKVLEQFKKSLPPGSPSPQVLFEITMSSLAFEGDRVDDTDFLNRVDTLAALGEEVLVSRFNLFYQIKSFLRQCTDAPIGIVIGASLLPKMFDEKFYSGLPGGIMEGMSRLFDDRTKMFVYPRREGSSQVTVETYQPPAKLQYLYKHLLHNGWLGDAVGISPADVEVHSSDVRDWLMNGDSKWKTYVPEKARALIESRKLFGYRA